MCSLALKFVVLARHVLSPDHEALVAVNGSLSTELGHEELEHVLGLAPHHGADLLRGCVGERRAATHKRVAVNMKRWDEVVLGTPMARNLAGGVSQMMLVARLCVDSIASRGMP